MGVQRVSFVSSHRPMFCFIYCSGELNRVLYWIVLYRKYQIPHVWVVIECICERDMAIQIHLSYTLVSHGILLETECITWLLQTRESERFITQSVKIWQHAYIWHTWTCQSWHIASLKKKCHFDEISIIACSQWEQCHKNNHISVLMLLKGYLTRSHQLTIILYTQDLGDLPSWVSSSSSFCSLR